MDSLTAAYKQVKVAVIVVIRECCAPGIESSDSGKIGNIGECSVAIVQVEIASSVRIYRSYEQVEISISIHISP